MAWQDIMGHDRIVERFRRALQRGRMASTFLFVGPSGIGKRTFALKLAQGLLCDDRTPEALDPCGRCAPCQQVAAGSHPDVELLSRPTDRAFIPLDLLIGDDEHRLRAGLCYNISLKPYSGKRRIAILDDADYLNREGANCLLKTLEEPPPGAVLILLATSEQRQLPTIRSRCQAVRFSPLTTDQVAQVLLARKLVENADEAQAAAAVSDGSVEKGAELLDTKQLEFCRELLHQLSSRDFDPRELAKTTGSFVDSAGKESAVKRARLKYLISFVVDYYQALMIACTATSQAASTMSPTGASVENAKIWWAGGAPAAANCIDCCLSTAAAVDGNANQSTLLECWFDELGQISRHGSIAAMGV